MRYAQIAAVVVIVLAVAVAIAAPIGPLPGFFIGGSEAKAPETWQDTSKTHEIRLRVDGTLPRVVVIWVIDHAGELYVVGSADSGWVKMIGEASPVQVRIGDSTYPLNARRATDGLAEIATAYMDKYRPDYPDIVESFPTVEEVNDSWRVFRLDRS